MVLWLLLLVSFLFYFSTCEQCVLQISSLAKAFKLGNILTSKQLIEMKNSEISVKTNIEHLIHPFHKMRINGWNKHPQQYASITQTNISLVNKWHANVMKRTRLQSKLCASKSEFDLTTKSWFAFLLHRSMDDDSRIKILPFSHWISIAEHANFQLMLYTFKLLSIS